jgi:hypothetical protein
MGGASGAWVRGAGDTREHYKVFGKAMDLSSLMKLEVNLMTR